MLLSKIFTCKTVDRYYFLYNFLVRFWIILNMITFTPVISEIVFGVFLNKNQYRIIWASFIIILFLNGLSVYLRWWQMNKELEEDDLSTFGPKKYR